MALQARTEFAAAINQIASEKGVDVNVVLDAIRQAALAAYRKDLSLRNEPVPEDFEELEAKIDSATGEISIYRGDENITPPGFARIAAQTAKQVIAQRLHEAEKGAIMDEYDKKVGTLVSGTIQRQEGNTYYVDLGRAEGVMPASEQTRDEYYHSGQRLKFFIKEIRESGRGPEVVVSRADAGLVKGLFASEVPEIQAGTVEIVGIAREAGGRTKVAARSNQDGVDPVGSLVGQKGVRVQAVIQELGEEKIDIVPYSDEPTRYIAAALAPAKDVMVTLNEEEKTAKVKVSENQLSLAIGKGGQNVRLAAKLTGWKIDIEGDGIKETEQAVSTTDAIVTGVAGMAAAVMSTDDSTSSDDQAQEEKLDEAVEAAEAREADVEKVEENIDEATAELSGGVQEEPEVDVQAMADAEEDMREEEAKEAEEKLAEEDQAVEAQAEEAAAVEEQGLDEEVVKE